jgi:response regulator RpfG family c-di-GMP phosphodiesterase
MGIDDGKPARVLLVDDEPRVLEGIALSLRRRYTIETAGTGAAALEILAQRPGVAVVISDMRMPAMDGKMFLNQARKVSPDTVRLVLTGQADLATAMAAVNEGQVFRFLTKPCPPAVLLPVIEAAVEQHRLLTSEHVLMEQTLRGAIKALTDVLSLANPAAFGRGTRVARSVGEMAKTLDMPDRWSLEVAALLSQLGFMTLPVELAERVHHGQPLTAEETEQVLRLPTVAEKILADIPRLELVRRILVACVRPVKRLAMGADEKSRFMLRASHMLRIAMDYDDLINRGQAPEQALAALASRAFFDPDVLAALTAAKTAATQDAEERQVPLTGLRPGMIAAEDIRMTNGALLVARGFELTAVFIDHAKSFRPGTVREPIRVLLHGETAPGGAPRLVPPEVPL